MTSRPARPTVGALNLPEREAEGPSAPALGPGGGATSERTARRAASLDAPVMTVDELAALLRVNRKSIYDAIARGEIPGVRRIGRTFRASREAVLAWLREGRVSRSRRT